MLTTFRFVRFDAIRECKICNVDDSRNGFFFAAGAIVGVLVSLAVSCLWKRFKSKISGSELLKSCFYCDSFLFVSFSH